MRRIIFGVVAIIGIALLIGGRILSTQTTNFSSSDAIGVFYLVGIALFVGGAQQFMRPNVRTGSLAASVGRTVVSGIVRLVVVVVVFVIAFVVVLNGSPEIKQAVLDSLYACRLQSHTFSPATVGFTVSLPTTTDPVDQPDTSTLGSQSIPYHQYSVDCGLDGYLVTYADLPTGTVSNSNTDTILQGSIDGIKAKSTLVSSADTTLQSVYPGKQFVFTLPGISILNKTITVYGAFYLVKDRLYEVHTQSPTIAYSESRAAAFLKSFSVTAN